MKYILYKRESDIKKAAMRFADYLFTVGAQKIMLQNGVMPANYYSRHAMSW